MRKIFTLLLLITSFVTMAQQNPPLPVDPNVRTGKLENGLTYYIRHNGLPENRAEFLYRPESWINAGRGQSGRSGSLPGAHGF